jgi:DNA-binding transcriptional MerR regulator
MRDNVSRSAAVHEGLIGRTSKSRGGYRLYDRDAVRRVHFIKQAQHCGFPCSSNSLRGVEE